MGFVPHVVDINNDGYMDIISGSYSSNSTGDKATAEDGTPIRLADIYVFHGNKKGTFGERKLLARAHTHAVACPVDWDGDGDYDLVTADRGSRGVCLMMNTGSRSAPAFEAPKPLMASLDSSAARSLMITSAVPADMNGDGLVDLVAGTEWGSIVCFVNEGRKNAPRFGATPEVLSGKSTVGMEFSERSAFLKSNALGSRLKVAVCDFDGDGVLDVLAGDSKTEYLTDEVILADKDEKEKSAYHEAKAEVAEYDAKLKALSDSISGKTLTDEEKVEYSKKRRALYSESREVRNMLRKDFPSTSRHGYVWFFKGV